MSHVISTSLGIRRSNQPAQWRYCLGVLRAVVYDTLTMARAAVGYTVNLVTAYQVPTFRRRASSDLNRDFATV